MKRHEPLLISTIVDAVRAERKENGLPVSMVKVAKRLKQVNIAWGGGLSTRTVQFAEAGARCGLQMRYDDVRGFELVE